MRHRHYRLPWWLAAAALLAAGTLSAAEHPPQAPPSTARALAVLEFLAAQRLAAVLCDQYHRPSLDYDAPLLYPVIVRLELRFDPELTLLAAAREQWLRRAHGEAWEQALERARAAARDKLFGSLQLDADICRARRARLEAWLTVTWEEFLTVVPERSARGVVPPRP